MIPVLILAGTFGGVTIGRLLFGRWFNHVTLYSGIWGITLLLVQAHLIHYYPITNQAWGYIVLAWVELLLGAVAIRYWLGHAPRSRPQADYDQASLKVVGLVVVGLAGLAALALIAEWVVLFRRYGNVVQIVFEAANERYHARITGDVPGSIPYVGSFSLAAALLAGWYTASIRRFTVVSVFPPAVIALQAITGLGRATLLIGGVLFATGFFVAPRLPKPSTPVSLRPDAPRLRRFWFALSLILAVGVGGSGFAFVSGTRGLTIDLPGVDPAMQRFARYVPFFPSIYSSFTSSPVVFSEYLKAGARRVTPGTYTLAPAWRVLGRLGLSKGVERHEENYSTPISSNVGTYLKNVYAEFGPLGIVWFPFLLSALTTSFFLRLTYQPRLSSVVIFAHLNTLVVFSFIENFLFLGYFYASAIVSWGVAVMLDFHLRERSSQSKGSVVHA